MSSAKRARQRERRTLAATARATTARPNPGVPENRRRNIAPTATRRWVDAASHMPPRSMTDHAGGHWLGASRILDRAARRRSERRSWLALKAQGRRDFVAQGSE